MDILQGFVDYAGVIFLFATVLGIIIWLTYQ